MQIAELLPGVGYLFTLEKSFRETRKLKQNFCLTANVWHLNDHSAVPQVTTLSLLFLFYFN